jgi:uncharacterized SAM-binding protein YcdF (DUF218 family)
MELGALKPILSAVALPPLSLLLLALLGLVVAIKRKRLGLALIALAIALMWLVSCHGTAVWLGRNAVKQFDPTSAAALKAAKVQAIVVLGGGILPEAPEYGSSQAGSHTAARLRYGVWLGRQTGLPLGFTGGSGWSARASRDGIKIDSEADVAARTALQDYGATLRWLEGQSRDTRESGLLMAPLLKRDGITRIALVTDAWHMERSVQVFEQAGLIVTPAPMGYVLTGQNDVLQWMPTPSGLNASERVMHEWLGLFARRWFKS